MIAKLLSILPLPTVYAHCDIPCGIYDPHQMQLAAHTVIRMTQLIQELKKEDEKVFIEQMARYTKVKEDHSEILKHELRVLWGDYFKEEHLKDNPKLHETVFKTLKLASKARQEINMDVAKELLSATQEIAEVFWKTKGRDTIRVASLYPTALEMVLPK